MKPTGDRGVSILDAVVSIAIFGVVLAAALPHLDPRRTDTVEVMQSLVGDLRMARLRAITGGVHYAVELLPQDGRQTGAYEVVEMTDAGNGAWVRAPYGWKRSVRIPPSVMITGQDGISSVEFNTRGMMVSREEPVTISVTDTFGLAHSLAVWPSGQVHVE